jgi:hypothetical protein
VDRVSTAGLIGAVLGLVVGWLDYRLVGGWVIRKLRETDRSVTAAEKADYERRIGWFRRLWFLATVLPFPFIGYWLGRTIAG